MNDRSKVEEQRSEEELQFGENLASYSDVQDRAEKEPEGREKECERELEEWRGKADEWLDKYTRALAEFANYRKRVERERVQQNLRMRMDVLRQLLPVVDDFELALESVPREVSGASWVEGILLIERKLKAFLEESQVVPIEAVGQPFDPTLHSALMKEDSEEYPEGTVVAELRKGYLLADQVLRPTLVKVSNGPGRDDGAGSPGNAKQ